MWLLSACPPARAVDLSWRLCFYCFQLRHKRTHSGKLYLSFIPVFFFLFFVSLLLPIALSFDKETIAFGSERRFSRLQQRESPPSSIPIEAASDRSDLCLWVRGLGTGGCSVSETMQGNNKVRVTERTVPISGRNKNSPPAHTIV